MINILTELSKYFLILCLAFYTLNGFIVFRYKSHEEQKSFYVIQNIFMVMIHAAGYAVLVLQGRDYTMAVFYCVCQIIIIGYLALYRVVYPRAVSLITNNSCMLITISLIMLARLSYSKCQKQFVVVVIGMVLSLILPLIVRFIKPFFMSFTWLFGWIGLGILLIVLIMGSVTYGSKLSFTISGLTFQPSEIVKVIFVFFMAALLSRDVSVRGVLVSAVYAMAYIGVLALSKDLGSALIFFVVYIFMLFVSTGRAEYLFAGLMTGSLAAVAGYRLFAHVRTRVTAWRDPFSDIEGRGYQITQSLFAIGTGGWFGMGLCGGTPNKIPVVEADFIFSAISEEMGVLFSVCMILVCISNFIMFLNIALHKRDNFYKLSVLGLGLIYGFQMFLTIGGVTKFIPLTGVTLPLVSYGGTSVLMTLIMFSLIQGIHMIRENTGMPEQDINDEED